MAEIIPFPRPRPIELEEAPEVDILTAVDVAIRDLRDIADRSNGETRRQAQACRAMLERAYLTALL